MFMRYSLNVAYDQSNYELCGYTVKYAFTTSPPHSGERGKRISHEFKTIVVSSANFRIARATY